MNLLIKNVLLGTGRTNILIEDGRFSKIGVPSDFSAAEVIDAEGLAVLPAFYNTHNHAAMSLLRGYADDMPLQKWLQEYIWPYEDKLTADDIERGSELALREMISGGSVFFNDMYFEIERTIGLVDRMGTRACIGITVMENHSLAVEDQKRDFVDHFVDPTGGRIQLAIAPHAIYTVGREKLIRSAEWARNKGLKLHIHLSETAGEVESCLKEHGMTPVRYLDSIGFLGNDVVAAHCVHIDEEEWDILAERGVTVSHCPCSNMKLGSGRFPYELAIRSGVRITLGTDGCSSNNNLDMREEMKFASLLAKCVSVSSDGTISNTGDPTLLPAETVMEWATVNGARAFGIDAGEIAEGKVADCILVDLGAERMNPCHNLVSNWVYSASSDCVRTVICDGKIIMKK
ncbi:MAG: amidohydrolase [Bacteroidales bacterium]|nr:amidohydrolase [Bacteroidales bacterium]